VSDETIPSESSDGTFACPECGAEIRLDPAVDATAFQCPSCGCELAIEEDGSTTFCATNTDGTGAVPPGMNQVEGRPPCRPLEESDQTIASPGGQQPTITEFLTQQSVEGEQVSLDTNDLDVSSDAARRYSIGEELARGGMGAVLSAKDMNLRRDVAMKLVLNPKQVRKDQLLRFVHEAQVTGQLEHPSIVPVHELGVDADDNVYYTMKFVNGSNLGDILKGIRGGDTELIDAYPLPRLLNIFIKACEALAFAHSRGVIHRDLKPDNIMVGDFGEVLIVDWGLAKVLASSECGTRNLSSEALAKGDADSPTDHPEGQHVGVSIESVRDSHAGTRTLDGAVMGTPAYMAPEQADGDIERMGPPADIYAMGAILHALLTLEAPFTGTSVNEILNRVMDGDFVAPDRHEGPHPHCADGAIPASLSSVSVKAMSADPEDRYATTEALQADVQAYLDGFATSAEDAGSLRLLQLFIARHRALFVSGVIAWAAITAVIAVAFVVNTKARRDAELAQATAEEALQAFKEEQARGIATKRTAAPSMVEAANTLIEKGQLENAALQVELAREYDPQFAPAHMLAAQLAIVADEHEAAVASLQAYLALVSDDAAASELLSLCHEAETRDTRELALEFQRVFSSQEAWQLADRLHVDAEAQWELHRKRITDAYGQLNPYMLRRTDDGLIVVNLHKNQGAYKKTPHLVPLKGLPIGTLRLEPLPYSDLEPLRGAPLKHLDVTSTEVVDLSPLAGMRLTSLKAGRTRISDLSPLKDAALTTLLIEDTLVTDLSPIQGMPIHTMTLPRGISDLSPLSGMPLRELKGAGLKSEDISALAGAPLEKLNLYEARVADIQPLQGMALTHLDLTRTQVSDLRPLQGMPLEELILWQTSVRDLGPLMGMPLIKLSLRDTKVSDIGPLRGMPLKYLNLMQTQVSDLSPLKGLPLQNLNLFGTAVTDLSPLLGMQLAGLDLHSTKVTDITPIEGMPLEILVLRDTPVTDLSVIPTLKTLRVLKLPESADALPLLRQLPNLKSINEMSVDAYRKQHAAKQNP